MNTFDIASKQSVIGDSLVKSFTTNFTSVNFGCTTRVLGHHTNTSIDFQAWLVRNNLVNAFTAKEIAVIEEALNKATAAQYHNLAKKLQPFFVYKASEFSGTGETLAETLALNINQLAGCDPKMIPGTSEVIDRLREDGEFGVAVACTDGEAAIPHPRRDKLTVVTQNGHAVKAVSLCYFYDQDFWATDKTTRAEIERLMATDEFRWAWPAHLRGRTLIHIHPKTGAQTWLGEGDLIVRKQDGSGVYPLTREAALDQGLIIKVPEYHDK